MDNIRDALNPTLHLKELTPKKYLFAVTESYAQLKDVQLPFKLEALMVFVFTQGKKLLFLDIMGILFVQNHSGISVL